MAPLILKDIKQAKILQFLEGKFGYFSSRKSTLLKKNIKDFFYQTTASNQLKLWDSDLVIKTGGFTG